MSGDVLSQQRLAEHVSQAIHGEYEGIEVYGTSVSNDLVYIEGDVDGQEFTAEVMVMRFALVENDDDLVVDEGDDDDE